MIVLDGPSTAAVARLLTSGSYMPAWPLGLVTLVLCVSPSGRLASVTAPRRRRQGPRARPKARERAFLIVMLEPGGLSRIGPGSNFEDRVGPAARATKAPGFMALFFSARPP